MYEDKYCISYIQVVSFYIAKILCYDFVVQILEDKT